MKILTTTKSSYKFFLSKTKLTPQGLPVSLRIIKDRKKVELSCGIFMEEEKWDVVNGLPIVANATYRSLKKIQDKIIAGFII